MLQLREQTLSGNPDLLYAAGLVHEIFSTLLRALDWIWLHSEQSSTKPVLDRVGLWLKMQILC